MLLRDFRFYRWCVFEIHLYNVTYEIRNVISERAKIYEWLLLEIFHL